MSPLPHSAYIIWGISMWLPTSSGCYIPRWGYTFILSALLQSRSAEEVHSLAKTKFSKATVRVPTKHDFQAVVETREFVDIYT